MDEVKTEGTDKLCEETLKQRDHQGGAAFSGHQILNHVHVCQLQVPVIYSNIKGYKSPEELTEDSKQSRKSCGLQL